MPLNSIDLTQLEQQLNVLPDLHIGVISTDVGAGPNNAGTGCSANGDDGGLHTNASCGIGNAYIIDGRAPDGTQIQNYPGSLDSAIDMQTAEVNPLAELLEQETTITHVFLNGRKAEEVFLRRVEPELHRTDIISECLPSTSPANAAMNFEAKLERWRIVAEVLLEES